ncbi:hypothetical protein NKH18_20480 [Streptomyces sp. M10(2022)]
MAHQDDQLTRVAFGVSEATGAARAAALRLLEADTTLHAQWVEGLAMNSAAPDGCCGACSRSTRCPTPGTGSPTAGCPRGCEGRRHAS